MERIESEQLGVLDYRINENHHYSVDIRWKNGKESQHNFPEKGFGVYNTETHQKIGFISGEDALEILREHSPFLEEEDFSWQNYLYSKEKKSKGKAA